jgi:hypothetical protein
VDRFFSCSWNINWIADLRKIIEISKSQGVIFITALLLLSVLVYIQSQLFVVAFPDAPLTLKIFYSFAIEVAILIFVLRGKLFNSVLYAVISTVSALGVVFEWELVAKILIPVVSALTLALYSHLIKEDDKPKLGRPRKK